ncbi:urease accessory protein UreD [Beijerinckia sp. L45]|uniref:urease accessory protein UreD n=1 Tax=Beijerinckia sp. L45 TaxID=1641855 RepID=UPI00131D913A|nr:urease accessory protein UreD [Beijerinckia sp. L45]
MSEFDPIAVSIDGSAESVLVRAAPSRPSVSTSALRAAFARHGGVTQRVRVLESGALRLRLPRHASPCEGIILNTGGGVLGGDRLDLAFALGAGAAVVLTTVAAEKIYRAEAEPATIATRLTLAAGARLDWLPQETILFDRARLARSLAVDMAADASLLAAEMLVFGRLAMGETAVAGSLRDDWRVRRDGRLVFADATRLQGDIATILDRPALGGGARAGALILFVDGQAEAALDPLRAALAAFEAVEAGASAFDGILVARLLARSPEALRAAMVAALGILRNGALPRVWQ